MSESLLHHYLDSALTGFRQLKRLADRAIVQVDDEAFFSALNDEANSIAVIMKHMAGNMRSRWTDFLTTDGEKPDRQRDQEFIIEPGTTREDIADRWETGWQLVFDTVASLQPADLEKPVFIRGESHSIMQAIHRQLTHYGYHVGQIVILARHRAGLDWNTLSIPRGQSEEFTRKLHKRQAEKKRRAN